MRNLTINNRNLAGLVSKDPIRPSMQHVYYNPSPEPSTTGPSITEGMGVLVATNGHLMGVFEVEPSEGDSEALIPLDAFKGLTKNGQILTNGSIEASRPYGATAVFPNEIDRDGPFPNWQAVWPDGETEGVEAIGFNPRYLKTLYESIPGKPSEKGKVRMEFRGASRAIVFSPVDSSPHEPRILLMPMMLDEYS